MGSEAETNNDGSQGSYEAFFKTVSFAQVVPSVVQQHPEVLNPSHLDHLHMDRYVPMLFVYQLADATDEKYQSFAGQLKASLAKALVLYYPMAGRVLKKDDPDHPRLFVFNDKGVPFAEAFLDQPMGPFLNLPGFKPLGFLSGFEPAGLDAFKQIQGFKEDGGGNVATFMQITRFNCGGVVVAFTWNHMLADMTGAVQFVTAWSEISRLGSTSIIPDHNRSILSSHHPSSPTSSTPPPPPPTISPSEDAKIQQVLNTKYTLKTLQVKKAAIDKAKHEVRLTHPQASTMDCLCAHLWRCLARVYVKIGVSDVTAFTTAVEGRSRMNVSPEYFGNVVTSASVMGIPAEEIISGPLSHPAALIRQAIRGITKETYWRIIDEMDLRNPWKTSINRTDYQLGLTSWIRFGLNDIDFGFGKPVYVGLNLLSQNARKGQCVVLPSPLGEGNFNVMMYLSPVILDALWADPEFTSLS